MYSSVVMSRHLKQQSIILHNLYMSTNQEADTPQGKTLEERIAATEQPETPQPQEETQESPAAMPTVDDQESSETLPTNETNEGDDLQLPEDASDRTKREFEKLKQQLREERQRNRTPEPKPQNVFDQFRVPDQVSQADLPSADNYQSLDQQQVNDIARQFVSEDGEVDIQRLNQALEQADLRAARAEQAAQQAVERITRYEEDIQLKEAYQTYPQLDPQHEKHDKVFYDLVSQTMMVEKYAKGGDITLKQAADFINKHYRPAVTNEQKIRDEAIEQYKEAQAKRNQGPVEPGKGHERQALADYEDLRSRSRRGDDRAIASRIDASMQ